MAAVSPADRDAWRTAGKVLANRAVGKLVEEGVSEPIARRMVAKSIADEGGKTDHWRCCKACRNRHADAGITGMGAAMAGGQYAATGAVADAMGRDRTDEEKAQIAHAGIEGFVGGALAAPFFTAMHKVDSAREQAMRTPKAAKSAANEIRRSGLKCLCSPTSAGAGGKASGNPDAVAQVDQSLRDAQAAIESKRLRLRQINADDETSSGAMETRRL